LCRGRRGVVRFNAKQNQRAISNGAHLGCRLGPDSLLRFQFIENETFRINRVSEMFSPDENSRRTRAREHASEVATNCTRSYYRDSWPFVKVTHWLIDFFSSQTVAEISARVSLLANT
jgi:hypothetical protein